MKRFVFMTVSLLVAFTSCNKVVREEILPEGTPSPLVPMSFNTVLPDTRTTADGVHVLWSDTDQLNIIEVDSGNQITEHTFSYQSGAGTGSAVFAGEVNSPDNTFYAVYPNQKLYNSPTMMEGTTIELKTLGQSAVAVENGFDPALAVMTAVADADGKLVFRHAMAYLKFTANSAALASVKVTSSGDARIYGRPVINILDGSPNTVKGTDDNSNITLSGSFVSGSSYMIPITIKPDRKLGTLTFLATDVNGVTSEISTASMSNVKPEAGHVYNLGTIPFSFTPAITFTAPGKLEYDATSGSFPYAVTNPVSGQSVTATLESGVDWISNIVVGVDAVTFTCSKNNATDAQERSAVITLHYTGAADVPVTVTQKKEEGTSHVIVNTYALYVNSSKELINSENYFNTGTGTSILDCNDKNNYFGAATSYTIEGVSYRYARKLDNSNPLSFTVSNGVSATLKFYCARREKTKTTSIKLSDGSSNIVNAELAWDDALGQAVLYESALIELTAGNTYSFAKSGDNIGIFYVEVVETTN